MQSKVTAGGRQRRSRGVAKDVTLRPLAPGWRAQAPEPVGHRRSMSVFCGHIAWTRHTKVVKRKGDAGKEHAFKANPSWRRTFSLALTTSAAGKIAKPVFVLREADGGKPGGSRLEEIKKFPFGDSTLGASAVIVTNPTVFLLGPFTRRLSSRT